MSSPKIKKKASANTGASMVPRQGAIPCLILIVLILVGLFLAIIFSFHPTS